MSAAPHRDVDLGLDLLVDRWLPLPPPGSDVAGWARDAAAELSEIDGQPGAVGRLAEQLLLWAADPARAGQDVAAVLVPEAEVGVYAWLTASRFPETPTDVAELAALAGTVEHVGEADVTTVPLPAGPAVRSRGIRAAAREDGLGELVEEVRWWVLPPLLASGPDPEAVEITMCWASAGAHEADDLAELADDIAATLVVRPIE
ncbi:hypothetical protein [Blastococcus sp. TF02A-30]|uniref:hypothetical protein n=1 Tax=Blastococcus sp. TF02A-30 TaxID=2250580 RepID=UPI000DEA2746|nr:hypothetical protein [Blastococcus sp. TF02A-30]RBY86309.1 hypothetical protein DQ241_12150 [Blastococcus sp. TF02A-30]